jgi:mono/diheme cytochrome c family protein
MSRARRLGRAGFAALLLGGLALPAGGQARPDRAAKVLEAEKIVLRDADGKVRAELALGGGGGASLALFDAEGKRRTRLAVLADGTASLDLFDQGGNGRAVLQVRPDGEPRLSLYDKNGDAKAGRGKDREAAPPGRDDPPAPVATPAALDLTPGKGAEPYRRLCQSCHGADGRAARLRASRSPIPDFTDPAWQAARSDAQLVAGVLNGRGDEMPAFGDRLSAAQARDLVAFVRAFGPANPRKAEAAADDFDRRLRQLQQQWDDLQRQVQGLRQP